MPQLSDRVGTFTDSVIRRRFLRKINLDHDSGSMFERRNLLKKLIIEEKHLRLHTLDRALIGNGLREIIRLGITPSGLQNHGPHRDPGVPGCHSEVQAFRERKALLADRAG